MPIYLIDKMSLKQQNINDNMSPYNDFSQFFIIIYSGI